MEVQVITNFEILATIVCLVLFRYTFAHWSEIGSMISYFILMACPVILVTQSLQLYWDESIGDPSDYTYAILYACLVPFFDCLKYSVIKIYENEYPSFDLALDSSLLETLLEICIVIYWVVGAGQIP